MLHLLKQVFGFLLPRQRELNPPPPPGDRRNAHRHKCNTKINQRLIVAVGLSDWPAYVKDISATGIGVICGMKHDEGTLFPVDLLCPERNFARTIQARVARIRREPDGHWYHGCAFERALDDEELRALL
jgi:hypothetical protein